jgi:putative ABC transport system permease protein
MRVLLVLAFRNVLQARRRTALLSAAIGIVTALLVLLTSLTGGLRDSLVEEASTMFAGNVVVAGFFKPTLTQSAPLVTHSGDIRKIIEDNTPGLDYISERGRGFGKMISATGSSQVGLSGVIIDQEPRLKEHLTLARENEYKADGSDKVLGNIDDLARPDAVLIFATQAKRLKVGVGDAVTIQTTMPGGQANTADVTIIGVAKDKGIFSSFSVFCSKELTRTLYQNNKDTTGAFWIFLKDIDQSGPVMEHLRQVFADKGYRLIDHEAVPFWMKFENVNNEDWTGQKVDITTWYDELSLFARFIDVLDAIGLFVVGLLVFVVAAGIMNTMWNAVRERTKEIGTMRAIGMSRGRVLGMFLIEALLLGLFATLAGSIVGIVLALGVDALHFHLDSDALRAILMSDTLHLKIRPMAVLASIGSLTTITGLSALLPAIRASLLRPITAIGVAE